MHSRARISGSLVSALRQRRMGLPSGAWARMAFSARRVGVTPLRLDAVMEPVGTDRVPGEQLSRPMGLVGGGSQSLWPGLLRPTRPAHGHDGQRPELVEGKGQVPLVLEQPLDAGRLAHTPPGEGLAQAGGALLGRRDDASTLLSRDPAGTAPAG